MSRRDRIRTLRIIWLAMVASTLLMTGVFYGFNTAGIMTGGFLDPVIMNIVGAVAMAQLVVAVIIRRRLVASIPDDVTSEERVERYAKRCIVSLALMEAGALLVIIFGTFTSSSTWVLAGGGSAAVLMVLARPSEDELER